MNIFVLDSSPIKSAQYMCDKHIPKMAVETVQMLVSALRRHNASDNDVPLTLAGTPHKGGYRNHPATVWAGESSSNFEWLLEHGFALCDEFKFRFGKQHSCEDQLNHIQRNFYRIPKGPMTDVALCVGVEIQGTVGATHAPIETAVDVYRQFYIVDKMRFAKWERGRECPYWWPALVLA